MNDLDFGRFIVLSGILLQFVVNRFNKKVGAIIGILVTITVFIWGMAAYSQNDSMMIFSIELSEPIFILLCVIWLCFDIVIAYTAFTSVVVSTKYDAVISNGLKNVEMMQKTEQPQNAIALNKTIIVLQIKQNFVKLTKSDEYPSIVTLLNLYLTLGMDAGSIESYKNGIDYFFSSISQTLKDSQARREFLLGMEQPGLGTNTVAFNLGKDLLGYIIQLPATESFSPQLADHDRP